MRDSAENRVYTPKNTVEREEQSVTIDLYQHNCWSFRCFHRKCKCVSGRRKLLHITQFNIARMETSPISLVHRFDASISLKEIDGT